MPYYLGQLDDSKYDAVSDSKQCPMPRIIKIETS
jgi:hypothetical protein